MKKIFFLLLFLFPVVIKADYDVTDYRIEITVLESGDLNIIEAFKIDGEYNGFKRTVNYQKNFDNYRGEFIKSSNTKYDGDRVILNEVRAINFSLDTPILEFKENGDLFEKVNKASKGSYGVYTINEQANGSIFTIYNSSKMNKDFYIDYTIKNVIINHEDVSEMVLDIFNELDETIDNLEIYIHIPNNKDILNIWVHELEVQVTLIDQETLKITSTNVDTNKKPYFRMIFDNITDGKKSAEIVFDKIIEIESKEIPVYEDKEYIKLQEDSYNAINKLEKSKNKDDYNKALELVNSLNTEDELKVQLLIKLLNIEPQIERITIFKKVSFTSLMGIWLIGLFTILYQMFKKYSSRKDYAYNDYPKALIGYLMRRKVNPNDLIVTILDLVNRKIITIKKENNDFKLKKVKSDNLIEIDERALKFLFENEDEIKASKLKEQCSKKYNHFLASYSNFINSLMKCFEENYFFEDALSFKIIGVIYTIIGIFIGILLINSNTYFSSYVIIIISLLFSVFFLLFHKKTTRGLLEYKKYQILRKKIIDIDKLDFENMSEDLIYALSLGCNTDYINLVKMKSVELNKKQLQKCNKIIEQYNVVIDLVNYLMKTSLKTKKSM